MHIDPYLVLAGLVVGSIVGLTGMGGGALMTPILVLLFHIQPLAAISSDLVASVVMKPFGGAIHLKHGTVHKGVVRWLAMGSVPGAFVGVLISTSFGKTRAACRTTSRSPSASPCCWPSPASPPARCSTGAGTIVEAVDPDEVPVRRLPTLLVGMFGGVVVGPDLGRLGLADDRADDAALPAPVDSPAGRHRPRAGRAARGGRGAGPAAAGRRQAAADRLRCCSARSPA